MSLKYIKTIERNIKTKMKQIRNHEVTVAESGIGKQFNVLKDLDEASYEKLLKEYVQLHNDMKK